MAVDGEGGVRRGGRQQMGRDRAYKNQRMHEGEKKPRAPQVPWWFAPIDVL